MTNYRFRVCAANGQEIVSSVIAGPEIHRALSIVLQDDEGAPRAGLKFTVRAGGTVVQGTTGEEGELSATLPGDPQKARITLHAASGDESYTLVLSGELPPAAARDDE